MTFHPARASGALVDLQEQTALPDAPELPGTDADVQQGSPALCSRVGVELRGDWRTGHVCQAIARIGFDYGHGAVADCNADAPVLTTIHNVDGKRLRLKRDFDAEARLLAKFKRCNELTRIDTSDGYPAAFVYAGRKTGPFTEEMDIACLANSLASHGVSVQLSDAIRKRMCLIEREQLCVEVQPMAQTTAYGLDIRVPLSEHATISISAMVDGVLSTPRLLAQLEGREPANAARYLPLAGGELVQISMHALRETLAPFLELLQGAYDPKRRVFKLSRAAAATLLLDDESATPLPVPALRETLKALTEPSDAHSVPVTPDGLQATLRPYQRAGVEWLNRLATAGLSGVLADDMGLGKTLQILAHLLMRKHSGGLQHPALIVCPTSLIANWRNEARRFAPDLRVLVLHGPERRPLFARIPEADLVITTYPLIGRDAADLGRHPFSVAVLDEAQAVQNPASKVRFDLARLINAGQILPVTGTPLSNHLGELWSLVDLANPGLLGALKTFRRLYRTPIEERGDTEAQARLLMRVRPFILRRSKCEVASELPPKIESVLPVSLGPAQRKLYELIRSTQGERVREALAKGGMKRSHILMLDALLKLRQACCDPRLVRLDSASAVVESAKIDVLKQMLVELHGEGRTILVFSQFTTMLDLIEDAVKSVGLAYARLDGDTSDREAQVDRFQSGEAKVFLLSLKAGGTGLNLTAADTVIHYDPWWSPAAENQATDRAHRIGQDKTVWVYRLIAEDSIEQRVQELQARKAELAGAILDGGSTGGVALSEAEVLGMFE